MGLRCTRRLPLILILIKSVVFRYQREPFISRFENAPVDVAGYVSHILDQMPEDWGQTELNHS